jgi:hypothetical protein
MSTLNDMEEHCDSCGNELEIGQIGDCGDCQDDPDDNDDQSQQSVPAPQRG